MSPVQASAAPLQSLSEVGVAKQVSATQAGVKAITFHSCSSFQLTLSESLQAQSKET